MTLPIRSRTLITGASGSYFWLPTSPPFVSKREPNERLAMILRDLGAAGDSEGRSRRRHERWLAARRCPVLRIEG